MIDKIKSELKLNVKEANWLMNEQDYDAEELIDQNLEDITDLIKGLKDSLVKSGLEEVKALGEPFDPSFHHAVSEQEDEKSENGAIINELQKGYTFNQRLIRPAMVVVNKTKPGVTTNHERPS